MAPLRKLFIFTTQLVSGLYRLFDHPTEIKDYFEKNNITNGQILLNSRGEILGSVGDRRFASKDTAPPYTVLPYTADRRFASKDTAKPYNNLEFQFQFRLMKENESARDDPSIFAPPLSYNAALSTD